MSSGLRNYQAINNFPVLGKTGQTELITQPSLSLLYTAVSEIGAHVLVLEAEMANAVTSVVSAFDASTSPCSGYTPVDLFDSPLATVDSTKQLALRPLISSDSTVSISHDVACGAIDLTVTGVPLALTPTNDDVQFDLLTSEISIGLHLYDGWTLSNQNYVLSAHTGLGFKGDETYNTIINPAPVSNGGIDWSSNASDNTNNVVVGHSAAAKFRGSNSTIVGAQAAAYTGTGTASNSLFDNSTFIGFKAGNVADGASNSVAIGAFAAEQVSGLTAACAVGTEAFRYASNIDYSTAFGNYAGQNASGALQAVFLGHGAGAYTEAAGAVFAGYQAGQNCTGYSNVAIGFQAMTDTRSSTPLYTVAVGYNAGGSNTIGSHATLLGANTGSTTVPDRAVCIGSGANTATTGRLSFGSNMESMLSSASMPNGGVPQNYIPLEWNGQLVYVPVFTTTPGGA